MKTKSKLLALRLNERPWGHIGTITTLGAPTAQRELYHVLQEVGVLKYLNHNSWDAQQKNQGEHEGTP